ncbi:MAG TPA: dTDP-4-dehydrorhamnose 3,5-epimerase family protein [Pyrinomonadaceae bacterium]|nr:dTDP-4-dehydrorhamnose 3,5-epimerase family protein [Pyrinomonadaceae bacterium]
MPNSFREGEIQGVVIRKLTKTNDPRGWLAEIFRKDDLGEEYFPAMSYISATNPGITRGPHEHLDQADLFCFIGPSNFRLRMWDNREGSETFGCVKTVVVGQDNPVSVLVPAGVVHAYQNVGEVEGIVINCPNRLYRGAGRKDEVDEIRHENDGDTIFQMED